MSLFPPIPYTPSTFRNASTSVQVFYHWNAEARSELMTALNDPGSTFADWYAKVDGPLSRLISHIEIRVDGVLSNSITLPTTSEARRDWFDKEWPPRLLGEVCGAIAAGAYDDSLAKKS